MRSWNFIKNPRRIPIPAGIIVFALFLYDELMFRLWLPDALTGQGLVVPFLFAGAAGGLLGLLTELLPLKAKRWAAAVLALIVGSVYLTAFFVQDAYHVFMTPAMILHGARGVAEDYGDVVAGLLLRDSWRIALILVPPVLAALLSEPTGDRKRTIAFAAAEAVLLIAAISSVAGIYGSLRPLGKTHDFESSIRSLGLPAAIFQNLWTDVISPETETLTVELPPPPPASREPEPTEAAPAAAEPEIVYEPNVLPIDFEALAQTNRATAEISRYIAAQEPTLKNQYTGLFAGKNLILITAEAFSKEVISPDRTPTLYRMAKLGIEFTDYYQPAWGASTTSGEMSNLFGLVPDCSSGMSIVTNQRPFMTMGSLLGKQGYWSACYHNNEGGFYDRYLTHPYLGYDKFYCQYDGVEVTNQWPMSDLEMMESTVPGFIDEPKFNVYYMTLSGHSVYDRKANAQARKHYEEVQDLPYSEPVKCYLAANQELEAAMAYLVGELEKRGIADDTVIVIAPDHYPYGLDASRTWGNYGNCLAELYGIAPADCNNVVRDHSALIIWSDCLEGMNIRVDAPTYSLDLLPTLSNLFGLEFDSRMFVGRDVFSDREPLVIWPNGNWVTEAGTYLKLDRTFLPNPGYEADKAYIDYISAIAKSKIDYSYAVQRQGYLRLLRQTLEQMQIDSDQ